MVWPRETANTPGIVWVYTGSAELALIEAFHSSLSMQGVCGGLYHLCRVLTMGNTYLEHVPQNVQLDLSQGFDVANPRHESLPAPGTPWRLWPCGAKLLRIQSMALKPQLDDCFQWAKCGHFWSLLHSAIWTVLNSGYKLIRIEWLVSEVAGAPVSKQRQKKKSRTKTYRFELSLGTKELRALTMRRITETYLNQ